MWNLRSGIIVRVLAYAPCLMFVARAEVEADASREFLDPPAQPSPGSAFNSTPAQVSAAAEDALQLLATVGHARVSAPEQMAGVLEKLRLESAAHLGRLDQEERTEMMAAMHGAGRRGGAGRPEHIAPAHGEVAAECTYRSVGNRIKKYIETRPVYTAMLYYSSIPRGSRRSPARQAGEASEASSKTAAWNDHFDRDREAGAITLTALLGIAGKRRAHLCRTLCRTGPQSPRTPRSTSSSRWRRL